MTFWTRWRKPKSAYHLYGKPGKSGENSNGTVYSGGNFTEKSNTFRGITKQPKFVVPFVWLTSARLPLEAEGDLFEPRPTRYLGSWWYKSNPFLFSETFSLQMVSALCFLRGPLECRRRRKLYTLGIILTWGRLLLQNVAWMVAKKLLVDDKIKACVKQVSWVLYAKFGIQKRQVKHFAFLKNVCYQYLYFLLWVTQLLFSYELLIGHNQLSWNVLLLSCNPTGQLCLADFRLQ